LIPDLVQYGLRITAFAACRHHIEHAGGHVIVRRCHRRNARGTAIVYPQERLIACAHGVHAKPFGITSPAGYHNDEVDKLQEQGRVLSNPDERKPVYRRIEDIIQREVPHVILYIAPAAYAWSDRLQDLRIGTDGNMGVSDGGLAQAWLRQ
jgi:hypothetical protein